MAITERSAADRAFAKLSASGEDSSGITVPNIISLIPYALQRFATEIAQDPDHRKRQLLQKSYSVSLTAGVGDLSSLYTQSEPLLPGGIDDATVFSSTSTTIPMQRLTDEAQLALTRPTAFIYYTISNSKIKTRDTAGSLTGLTGNVSFISSYIPVLSSLPVQLEDQLVNELVTVILESRGSAAQAGDAQKGG